MWLLYLQELYRVILDDSYFSEEVWILSLYLRKLLPATTFLSQKMLRVTKADCCCFQFSRNLQHDINRGCLLLFAFSPESFTKLKSHWSFPCVQKPSALFNHFKLAVFSYPLTFKSNRGWQLLLFSFFFFFFFFFSRNFPPLRMAVFCFPRLQSSDVGRQRRLERWRCCWLLAKL